MADRNNTLLAIGLLAAIGAYLVIQSRKTGVSLTQAAVDAGSDVVNAITNVFGGSRGIRNNNPGNIVRSGASWLGMSSNQTDSRFVVFDAPEYGIRALARVLKNYIAGGYTTVESIINRWAPPTENATSAYVAAVSNALGVAPNEPLDASYIQLLVPAIIQHENGQQPYPSDLIARGLELEQTT